MYLQCVAGLGVNEYQINALTYSIWHGDNPPSSLKQKWNVPLYFGEIFLQETFWRK